MAADVAMDDIDIDFDLDPEIVRLQAEADAINAVRLDDGQKHQQPLTNN